MNSKEMRQAFIGSLAERLNGLMDAAGITIGELARASGLSYSTIENLRTGKAEPGATVPIILADYFAVPLDYLCGRMDEETSRAVLEDYPRRFMEVRRMEYEAYMLARKKVVLSSGFESPWPYNLYEDVVGDTAQSLLREDQIAGMERAVSSLTDRERESVYAYFRDGISYEKIARRWDVTTERARQICAKAERKLRHPARKNLFVNGYHPELDEAERELAARRCEIELTRAGLNAEMAGLDEYRAQIGLLRGKLEGLAAWDEERRKLPDAEAPSLNFPVEEMELSVRAYNVLSRAGIKTLGQIIEADSEGRLWCIRNMGRKSYAEVLGKVRELLHLGETDPITVKGDRA